MNPARRDVDEIHQTSNLTVFLSIGGHDTFVIIKVIHVDYCKFENCENKQLLIHPSTLNNHFKPLEIETSFLIKGPSGKIPATVNTTKMDCMTSM